MMSVDSESAQSAPLKVFDGFLSYSHAADGLLAPRLQAALQRFAKPWWKRRAVRIFRDDSSLSANPHLWSSITEALDTSGWFVLLLSPDAAQSEWVNQEISYWVEHRDPKKILPVVTDGTFGWADRDVTGDAVPDALRGVFSEEPRWVDVRWARGEEQLDLKDPRFGDVVADIASTIRGIPKDELASEEVRQHRRTVRTAWAAGMALAVLTVAAVGFGLESSRNADEAERQASLARSRELASSAIGMVDDNPLLAKLLALYAISLEPSDAQPVEVVSSLWQAATSDRLEKVVELGGAAEAQFDVAADGTRAVLASQDGDVVRMYGTPSMSRLWEWRLSSQGQPPSEDAVSSATTTADAGMVAVGVMDATAELASPESDAIEDPRPNRIVILDGDDGTQITQLLFPHCSGVDMGVWSPDGTRLAVRPGMNPCVRPGAPSGWWVEVFDTETWESIALLDLPADVPFYGVSPEFDASGRLFVFGTRTIEVYGSDFELLERIEGAWGPGDVSGDGSMIVTADPASQRVALWDTTSGRRLTYLTPWEFPQFANGVRFSSGGRYVIYGNDSVQTWVWDVATGEVVWRLPGGTASWVYLDEESMKAFTGHAAGEVKVWDLTVPHVGRIPIGDLGDAKWVDANSFAIGPNLGAFIADDLRLGKAFVRFFDLTAGALYGDGPGPEIPGHNPDRITNSDRIIPMMDGRFVYQASGHWIAYDPATGEEQSLVGCDTEDFETCSDTGNPLYVLTPSLNGSSIIVQGGAGGAKVIDANTGDLADLEGVEPPDDLVTFTADWFLSLDRAEVVALDRQTGEALLEFGVVDGARPEVSPSGRTVVIREQSGIVVVDTETLQARRIDGKWGDLRGIAVSPDDALVALGDERAIHIVDLSSDTITQSLGVGNASDIYWLGADEVLVGTSDGSWARVSLDVRDLIDEVRSSLLRSFTPQECTTYRIDPCPTLQEMRNG